jgi:hypothetical protein
MRRSPSAMTWTHLRGGPTLAYTIAAAAVAIGGLLLAGVALSVLEQLFGLAGLACAACADPSNGIDTVGAVGGIFGGGVAAGGAAAGGGTTGTGETGGVGTDRYDRTILPPPGGGNLAGDASRQDWTNREFRPGLGPWERRLLETSEGLETWARTWIPEDLWGEPGGTAPASKA